jgi:hypothetical protein
MPFMAQATDLVFEGKARTLPEYSTSWCPSNGIAPNNQGFDRSDGAHL